MKNLLLSYLVELGVLQIHFILKSILLVGFAAQGFLKYPTVWKDGARPPIKSDYKFGQVII